MDHAPTTLVPTRRGRRDERLGDFRLDNVRRTLGLVRKEVVDLARRTVVGDDSEALVVHVEDQVLAL